MYKMIIKRSTDIFISCFMLLLTSPLFLLCFFILKVGNKNERVFFLQKRPGKDARMFKIIKFKTMIDRYDSQGILLADEKRLTRIGKFLRGTSLDELPQLINVIKGDMSLVGPRPLLPQYLSLYTQKQAHRHDVRPGITGWAQVNGRNDISWEKKFELDVWYVDHLSFGLDMKIIFLTIWKVLKRDGVSKEGMTTTEPFNGYN